MQKFQIFVIGFAFAAILLIPVNDAFADHAEVSIGTVEGSVTPDCSSGAGCNHSNDFYIISNGKR